MLLYFTLTFLLNFFELLNVPNEVIFLIEIQNFHKLIQNIIWFLKLFLIKY